MVWRVDSAASQATEANPQATRGSWTTGKNTQQTVSRNKQIFKQEKRTEAAWLLDLSQQEARDLARVVEKEADSYRGEARHEKKSKEYRRKEKKSSKRGKILCGAVC